MHNPAKSVPAFALYGEGAMFPDLLHCEPVRARAGSHDWRIAEHLHPEMHQFFLVQSGGFRVTVEGSERDLRGPVALSMPRGVRHGFLFETGTEGLVVSVPHGEVAGMADATDWLSRLQVLYPPEPLRGVFDSVARWHDGEARGRAEALRALVRLIVCEMQAGGVIPSARPLAERFGAMVRERAAEHLTVEAYAAALGTSVKTLSRVVRAATGRSVQQVARDHLMREARKALAYTPQPISMIAYGLGYDDPSYFSRVFTREAGLSPRAYRAQFRG